MLGTAGSAVEWEGDLPGALAEALAGAPSAAELARRVVRALRLAARADSAVFGVPTDDGRHLVLTSDGLAASVDRDLSTLPLSGPSPIVRAIRRGEPVFAQSRDEVRAAFPGSAATDGLAALACLPVATASGVAAGFALGFAGERRFDGADRAALGAVARDIGRAFDRARLHDAAVLARTRLVTLAEASARLLEAGQDTGRLLAIAARLVTEATGDPCVVGLATEPGGPVRTAFQHPDGAAAALLRAALRRGPPQVRWDACPGGCGAGRDGCGIESLRSGTDTLFVPVADPDVLRAHLGPALYPLLERHPVHGLLAAPLRTGGPSFGTLVVFRHRAHAPFSMDDRLLVEGLADRTAVALAYARLASAHAAARTRAEQAAERTATLARRQALLARASRAFSEAQGDLGRVSEAVAAKAAEAAGAAARLYLLSGDGRHLALEAVHEAGHARTAAAPGEALAIRAVREDGAVAERWVAAVPLRSEGRVSGALVVARDPDGPALGGEDLGLLSELAAHASLAIAHARERQTLLAERQRLSEVLQSAQVASRAKDEFLAMLSHELRNPLSPIVTALHLMRLHAPEAAPRERTVIERQVTHLVRLVDDLLDVSRVMRGKVRLERRVVELSDVVARAVEQASPLLEVRRHALALDVAEGLALDADDHRIAQVIANLLTNAAKYTDAGGRITLRARAEAGLARISVEDNGIGISPALLPHVFDLFVQGERTLDRAPGGLGIGLTIVRSLVDLHGGRVAVESGGAGRGSTFTVWLPLSSRPVPPPAPPPERAVTGAGVRVLVVDDNADAADLLAEALRARGHDARVALDGPSALAVLDEHRPRVALLDLGLPVMDGYELARRLRAWADHAPIGLVAVTGYGQELDRRASAQAGFDVHLVKPVDLDVVCDAVERLARAEARPA